MNGNGQARHREQVIPNNLRAIALLQDEIMVHLGRRRYDEDATFAVMLGLAEALANAYEHGNLRDPGKRIFVRYYISQDKAVIEITDEGDGFDPQSVPDARQHTNLERCHGRGLLLMKALLDEVRFSRSGSRVHLIKRNQDRCMIQSASRVA